MRNYYSILVLSLAGAATALAEEPIKPDTDGVQRIRIVGGSYFFKPGHIVVKANVPVELLASRESGITPHHLVIRAPEAGVSVEEGLAADPKKILFTATKPGKYAIYCSKKLPFVAGHRDRGMEACSKSCPSRRTSSGSAHTPAPSARA